MSAMDPATAKREKILIVVTAVMMLALSIPLLNYLFGSSVSALKNQNVALREQVNELEELKKAALASGRRLDADLQHSLPAESDKAVSLYKNWLLELVGQVGFEKTDITPNTTRAVRAGRSRDDQYLNHQFTVRVQGTFVQMGDFLHRFYETDMLHLIRSINLKPIDNARKLDIAFGIEALTIPGTKNMELVLSPNPRYEDIAWNDMKSAIAARNVFAPFSPTPEGPQETEPSQPRRVDPTPYTYINAITWLNGKPQVWIHLRTEGKKHRLFEGEEFQIGRTRCIVRKIHDRSVEIEAGGALWAIKLGTSFADGEEILEDDDNLRETDEELVDESSPDDNLAVSSDIPHDLPCSIV